MKNVKLKNPETTLINLKVRDSEREAIIKAAKLYAEGNVSAWLRYAALHFKPAKGDIIR